MLKIIGIGLIVLALLVLSAPGIPNAHATGGLPESTTIPSYITVSEVGLPPGYDWTIQTWIQTPGRQITINESIPDGSSAYVSTAGLVGFDAYFQAWQPVGGIYKYVGNFIGFPLGGFIPLISGKQNYTFYFYQAINISFVVQGLPFSLSWYLDVNETVQTPYSEVNMSIGVGRLGSANGTFYVLPGTLYYRAYVNPDSGYIPHPSSWKFLVNYGPVQPIIIVTFSKQPPWYALFAHWFNEGISTLKNYWWGVLSLIGATVAGYLLDNFGPSKDDFKRKRGKR
ncbi:hypothetical protein GCM10007108_02990 [Thermogymnomonas acidicola]|uniref:Uncharacterized protein n=1 Tax=Thermogymnomonas acidicola TaxID=399579 RepID=A0AA37F8U2_9ARCH|nr:hypothetical protein [Thermogymnomonas acidicola]GGM68276.1 hypothetical protein GCM10007108_02990 [Thermogymnomonas acidicola]